MNASKTERAAHRFVETMTSTHAPPMWGACLSYILEALRDRCDTPQDYLDLLRHMRGVIDARLSLGEW